MLNSLEVRVLSSLAKCFPDEHPAGKEEQRYFPVFRGQTLAFQIAYRTEEPISDVPFLLRPVPEGALAPYVSFGQVESIPSLYPVDPTNYDENYLRTEPGLYPDPIRPLYYRGCALLYPRQICTLWVAVKCPEDLPAGEYPLTIRLVTEEKKETLAGVDVTVALSGLRLPEQRTYHTEWLYTDCLAERYHAPVWSERHWEIVGNYIRTAAENGVNMILTPVITPELDTYVGGERLTTQLVDITVQTAGGYVFSFEKLDRWIKLCTEAGIKYFEFPHFFTQWGAKNAPKIVAQVNGCVRRIFGWETDALGADYAAFLGAFLPALAEHLKRRGIAERCWFHISDEPKPGQLERYRQCRDLVAPYLDGCRLMDALSDYAFAEKGIVSNPVVSVQHLQPFLDAGTSPLWCYYSGAHGCRAYTGRYLSMPLARTRIIGVQMYMADISGFLHWGYNFWHTKYSYDTVDPFLSGDCGGFNPSGDCFLVYPGEDGTAMESLRLHAMRGAMEDIRMLELYESRFGRKRTKAMLLELAGGVLNFREYPQEEHFFQKLTARVMADCTEKRPISVKR